MSTTIETPQVRRATEVPAQAHERANLRRTIKRPVQAFAQA
jgi:hypothetical protein